MWGEPFSWLKMVLAIFFSGWAVKLLDDYLDRDWDQLTNQPNLYQRLGDGLPAYMAMALVAASALDSVTAAALFTSAYAIGMGRELGERYWGGWPAWMETLVAVVIGWLISPRQFFLSLALMVVIQLADDLHDWEEDSYLGQRTTLTVLGRPLSIVTLMVMIGSVILTDPIYGGIVLGMAWLVSALAKGVSSGVLAVDRDEPVCFGDRIRVGSADRPPRRSDA